MATLLRTAFGALALVSTVPELDAARAAEPQAEMTQAARLLVSSFDDAQRARALFPLEGDERFELRLAPVPEWGGLPLSEMGLAQVVLLHRLLGASLSASGFAKATGILALEDHLVKEERARGQVVRVHGIERYSAAFFGDPAGDAPWGWRLQGHHLSLNFVVSAEGVASAPAFLGAQPHRVESGPRAGWRVLGAEEDDGRRLLGALDEQRLALARLATEMPRDMFAGAKREYDLGEPRGIAYAELAPAQQAMLRELVDEYVENVPTEVAARRRAAVERGGWEGVRFAFIGSTAPGERLYYRVHGAEFLIEYCAVAQSPNHVHTIWREKHGDFGPDLLAAHLNGSPH